MRISCITSVCTTQISVHHYLVAAQLSSLVNIRILSSIFNKINTWKIALNKAQKNDKICKYNASISAIFVLLSVQIACQTGKLVRLSTFYILFSKWSCKASHLLQTSHGFRYSFMCQCPTRSMLQSPYCLSQLYLCSTTNLIINRHIFLPNIFYYYLLQILVLFKHFIKIKTSIISLIRSLCLK